MNPINDTGNPMSTGLIVARCPSCGGVLSPRKDDYAECRYCGSSVALPIDYDLKALGFDTEESFGWYSKGVAALATQVLPTFSCETAIKYFDNAIKRAARPNQNKIKRKISDYCSGFARARSERYSRQGGYTPSNVENIHHLFVYADNIARLNLPSMKYLVAWTYEAPYFNYYENIPLLVNRIREIEPGYLTPEEKRWRTVLFLTFVAIVALIGTCYLLWRLTR